MLIESNQTFHLSVSIWFLESKVSNTHNLYLSMIQYNFLVLNIVASKQSNTEIYVFLYLFLEVFMENSSFGESFNERLQKLCKKYEKIKDNDDQQIDLYKMDFIDNKSSKKAMKKIVVGSLFKKNYKRKTESIISRYDFNNDLQEYERIYKYVFCKNTFNDIYKYLSDKL